MKFHFVVSRVENLFFFVSNLSMWHFSCRPDYNDAWLELTGSLNKEEEEVLNNFKDLMKKRGFIYKRNRSLFLGRSFFIPPESGKWVAIRSNLSKKDFTIVKQALSIFEPRFNKIWKRSRLEEWVSILERESKKDKVKDLFKNIESFIGSNRKKINVHLIASPSIKRAVSGGANIGEDDLTLEVPVFKTNDWNVGNGIAVLAHEYTHILIDGRGIVRLLSRFLKKYNIRIPAFVLRDRQPVNFFKEILTEACAPYGYFCSGVLGFYEPTTDILLGRIGFKTDNYNVLMAKIVWGLYPVMASYKLKGNRLDKKFLSEVNKILAVATMS